MYHVATLLAEHGMVAIAADYRVETRHQTDSYTCVRDGRSAMCYVRQHVALCATLVTESDPRIDEPSDDLTVSPAAAASALFNPVCNTGPQGYG